MYKERSGFNISKDMHKVWRYMSLSKFVYLLSGKLYFARTDQFQDNFEGIAHKYSKKIDIQNMEEDMKRKSSENQLKVFENLRQTHMKAARHCMYISCWHSNEFESAALWDLYSKCEGIAIQSTVDRLKKSFNNEKRDIHIGEVKYINYDTDYVSSSNIFNLVLNKRKSFEHEKEIRCILQHYDDEMWNNTLDNLDNPKGYDIEVALNTLIEKIYISPFAPSYMKIIIDDLIEKYDYNFYVTQSNLYDPQIK